MLQQFSHRNAIRLPQAPAVQTRAVKMRIVSLVAKAETLKGSSSQHGGSGRSEMGRRTALVES